MPIILILGGAVVSYGAFWIGYLKGITEAGKALTDTKKTTSISTQAELQ